MSADPATWFRWSYPNHAGGRLRSVADPRVAGLPAREPDAGQRHAWRAANGNGSGLGLTLPSLKPAEPVASYEGKARYCPMLAVDIKAFNDPKRGEDVQRFLRAAMYELLAGAFGESGVQWSACHHEDRGDGVLVIAPPGAPATALIDPLVDHLRAGIRRHNKLSSELARIRLRTSVHAGQVHFDENGVSGHAVTLLFRMLEAVAFKRAFDSSGTDFALVASAALYEDVISQGPGLIDPGMYAPINIRCKETRVRGWLYLPPVPNPFLLDVSGSRRRAGTSANERTGRSGRARRRRAPGPGDGLPGTEPAAAVTPLPTAAPARLPTAIAAALSGPRAPLPKDPPGRESMSARARLIASRAVAQGWLASVPGSASVQARFRGGLHPGQRFQHV